MNPETRNEVPPTLRVIPREQHSISRKNISKAALRVLYRLHDAGFAAYLVGGAVRDLLLGGHPKDFDVATDATPDEVKGLFRNCRLIGRRFRLAHVVFGPEIIEVATFRGTGEEGGEGDRHIATDGRIVRDNIWGTIEEDAVRRDFRVNALYYDIADFSVRDFVGGMQDLEDRTMRLIGDPDQRYREDPVRMLRAARLAAKLGFTIDAAASAPFATLGHLLTEAAPARLFDESLKLFLGGHGLKSFKMLEACGLLKFLFPATARALERGDNALRALVEQGLANTDARIAEGKSVTPAFLYAVLLWGEVRDQAQGWIAQGYDVNEAWQHAAVRVVGEQCQRVAIPRRFTFTMEEIWSLQPRFEQIHRKRVFRLMSHPRFRAAFDFLLLRAPESDGMRELGEWWAHAQQLPPEMLAAALGGGGVPVHEPSTSSSAPARKRRRRRKPTGRGKGGSGDA
ncbi:MAG: polynucleotide adenylyltransferase PcnB [Luteibacter sp.]|uniref:polynucleotide adenylyltransferase PcnB n=1 Tax=Luteibacter TaxID=242605 RepID=UPI0005686C2A|nr:MULTISPECIES: polynucleotide adenylyltransferase PcnB [unclassified Luteibacter]MDQ7996772.1 polynucleotide adenylyltransferase PcnB [Luteibacter sp.]MDQ8050827.1 polynucleotide adenylyltransferase PcnB [Luteibacter sp.]MDR6643334.1 poly(A) polymerase [Luteibacter sp. 1214]